ncbi:hypothetical protein ACFLZ4_01650, partial [Patescibacteria group bacterium]
MKEETNKNIFPLVLIIAVILILVGGAYWYSQQIKSVETEETSEPTGVRIVDTPESTEEEDMEEGTEEEEIVDEEEEIVEEEMTEEELADILALLFAEKYEKDAEDANVTVSVLDGSYAQGGITFEGEMGGGYFFAAEVGGEWSIVFDGNGTTPCDVLEAVDFPIDMVPECW